MNKSLPLLVLLCLFSSQAAGEETLIKQARIDLSQLCPERSTCQDLSLSGNWGGVKGRILSPEEILEAPMGNYLTVPGGWNPHLSNPLDPRWEEALDVGTYWLILDNLPKDWRLGMRFDEVSVSFRAFWLPLDRQANPIEIINVGWNQDDPMRSVGMIGTHFVSLPQASGDQSYLLVIHVANPSHARGGLRLPPVIGDAQLLNKERSNQMISDAFLIGAMLIIAVYHILIYIQRRDDKASLWLAVQCIVIACHSLGIRGYLEALSNQPSDFVLGLRFRLVYAAHFLGPLAFYGYLCASFPKVKLSFASRIMFGSALILSLLMFSSLHFFTRFYLLAFISVMIGQIIFILARSAMFMRGDRDLQVIIIGALGLGIAGSNDGLSGAGVISNISLMAYAQIIFILLQGGLISKRFATAYATAKHLSHSLQKEVEQQTRDIKSILETIHQGIFTVETYDLKIGHHRSKFLDEMLEPCESAAFDEFLLDRFPISGDQKSQIREALKFSLDNDQLNWDINRHLLPSELRRKVDDREQVFEVEWSPMLSKEDIIEKYLICLKDVTELRSLQQKSQQHEEDLLILDELLSLPEDRFKMFIKRIYNYLADNKILIDSLSDMSTKNRNEVVRQIFINLHTVKGTARSLHLQAIASVSHEVEQYCAAIQKGEVNIEVDQLDSGLNSVRAVVERYERVSHDKLGWDQEEESVKIPRQTVMHGIQSLAKIRLNGSLVQDLAHFEAKLQSLARTSLQDLVLDCSQGLESIARDFKKMPPIIDVKASQVNINSQGLEVMHTALTHLLRNSLDHGLETSDERLAAGKEVTGKIVVQAAIRNDNLFVIYYDDGRGLNLEKIWEKAKTCGLVDGPMPTNSDDIKDLIFHPGLSTKEQVTDISGRGVGMDAIKTHLERSGSSIEIVPKLQDLAGGYLPFEFKIKLNSKLWWEAVNVESLALAHSA